MFSIIFLLLISFVSAYYPYFSLSDFGIFDLYYEYSEVFDFLIFLLIFLSLTKSIFKDHFKESKGVYIGIGILLAFSLLLWERDTGFSMIGGLSPFAFFIFLLLCVFLVFKWLKEATGVAVLAGSITYLAFYFFYSDMVNYGYYSYYSFYPSYFPFDIQAMLNFLLVLAIIGVIYGIVKLFGEKTT